ncbi:MAG: heparinase II/III family protein [Candidatus Brocadiia bacterium]
MAVTMGSLEHPYLYLTSDELPALKRKFQKEPFATRWERLMANADRFLDEPRVTADAVRRRALDPTGVAGICAFAWLFTGEKKYAERAVQEAMGYADTHQWHIVRQWNDGADLPTAHACFTTALVYDWCYDYLSPEQREYLEQTILKKGLRVYLRSVEEYRDWWVSNKVSNWCGVLHGGCGVAGLALYNVFPEARYAFDHAWPRALEFLDEVILADGGGHEGVMYWRYGVRYSNYLIMAAERLLDDDRGIYERMTERLPGYWDVYLQGPDLVYANFNDMNEHTFSGLYGDDPSIIQGGPSGHISALFESKVPGGDELLLWAADNGGPGASWKGTSPFWFLWRREAPPVDSKPELQDAVLFRGAGHVVWQSPHLWFVYNGGWVSDKSHHNRDLGTFFLVADGERFVNDPGYGAVETSDHSTVTINRSGQFEGAQAHYRRYGSGDGFHYFASDLTDCYVVELDRFVRHGVMVDGKYVVLLDDLATPEPSEFTWRMHSKLPASAAGDGRRTTVSGEQTDLHVVCPCPADAEVTVETKDLSSKHGDVAVHTTAIRPAATAQTTIVTVLYPTASGGDAPEVSFSDEGRLLVKANDREDEMVFARGEDGWELRSVNGADASGIGTGDERTLRPLRPAHATD